MSFIYKFSFFFLLFLDCLSLQFYKNIKDRQRQVFPKESLSLEEYLGVEYGFTLDKELNTLGVICQDKIVILAFDTKEKLIQWQVC